MPSYVITGASRGLGFEFLRQLSASASNTVIGLVRNKAATETRLAAISITNVHIFEADITDFEALKRAAAETEKLTGGSLDYLVNNAAATTSVDGKKTGMDMVEFENDMPRFEKEMQNQFAINVVGVAKTIAAFLPLIKKSEIKKVITISSGMADLDMINEFSVANHAPYSSSKAAVNVLVAKYNTAYRSQGILFMSISPGFVNTSEGKPEPTPEELEALAPMIEAFQKYSPTFTGPITPQDSIEKVLKVINSATVEKDGGSFVSHYGNKLWL